VSVGFAGTLNFGGADVNAGSGDSVLLAKLSPSGGLVWQRSYGYQAATISQSMAALPDGVAVATSIEGPIDYGTGVLDGSSDYSDVVVARFGQ
jgi:hypothetical protein